MTADDEPAQTEAARTEARRPRAYLVLHHIVKSHNVGALIRSADAFGVHEIVVVGRRQILNRAAVGMARCVKRVPVHTLEEAEAYLRDRGCQILGVEVDANARRVDERPFVGDTAFILGNEGDGLTERQRAMCDGLVRIPQYGHARSLNVHVAGAIVLHHFAAWADFPERPIEGQKFVPAEWMPGRGGVATDPGAEPAR